MSSARSDGVRLKLRLEREGLKASPYRGGSDQDAAWHTGYENAIQDITLRYTLMPSDAREGFSINAKED